MIDPKEDELSHFAHWYLTSGEADKVYTPIKENTKSQILITIFQIWKNS